MWSEVRSVTPCNYPHLSTPNQCLAGFVQIVSLCAELFEGSPRQATLSGSNIDRSRNYNGPCGWSEMWVIARWTAWLQGSPRPDSDGGPGRRSSLEGRWHGCAGLALKPPLGTCAPSSPNA